MSAMRWMIAFLLSLGVLLAAARVSSPAAPGEGPGHGDAAWWLARAEQYAAAVAEPKQQTSAWMAVAAAHGRRGDFDAAHAAARRIAEPDEQLACLRYVTIRTARSGDFATAGRFAQTIDEPLGRAAALAWIVRIQAEHRRFDAARETLALVDDPAQLAWARYQLAYEEAAAGLYDEALREAARIEPARADDELLKEDLLAWIAEAHAADERHPPKPPTDAPAAQARRMLGPLGYQGLSPRELARLKRQADRAGSLEERLTALRRIAWIHLTESEPAEAREALGRAESHLTQITPPAERLFHAAAVADLYLELGEHVSARRLLDDHLPAGDLPAGKLPDNEAAALQKHLADYRTAPLLLGVVARTAGPDRAAAVLRSHPGACRAAWWATGAFCGWLESPNAGAALLDAPAEPPRKFALAMGVAQGLAALGRLGPDRALSRAP